MSSPLSSAQSTGQSVGQSAGQATAAKFLTLGEFLNSAASGDRCEFMAGTVRSKVSPKRFHSKIQRTLLRRLEDWGAARGEVGVEWAVVLKRQGQDWVPVPDLSYVAFERLPENLGDTACPVPFDLAVEIISPEQSFGKLAEKATDYIVAGVQRVWVVDPRDRSITVFKANELPRIYRDDRPLLDPLLPEWRLTPNQLFQQAGLTEP